MKLIKLFKIIQIEYLDKIDVAIIGENSQIETLIYNDFVYLSGFQQNNAMKGNNTGLTVDLSIYL